MSRPDLAKAVGVTFHEVQKYRNGMNRVGGSRLDGVAKALEAPISCFFDHMAEEMEAASGSLLNTHDAISLLRAYVAIQDQRQCTALVNLVRHDREEPLQEDGAVH